jgi:hypothetical protein
LPRYRITIRFGHPRQEYTVLDIEADDLASVLRLTADSLPEAVSESADLAEIRLQTEPDSREYTEG